MGKHLFFILFVLLNLNITVAQKVTEYQLQFQTSIKASQVPIKIDGILDEAVWANTQVANNFKKKYPNDIGEAKSQTEVRYTYDDKNLYFAFKVYDSGAFITQSLKRDIGHDGNDGIGIVLDPLNQKTNGFFFVLSAMNVQSEDQLSSSTERMSEWRSITTLMQYVSITVW